MLVRFLNPLRSALALLGLAALLGSLWWFRVGMQWHRQETLTRSLSTFVSLQSANAYVITRLTNTETFEVVEHHWVLEDYPVGETRARVSLPATYYYYIKPQELAFRLEGRTLYVDAGPLHLLTPVAFDTRQVSQWGEKYWFGRGVDVVLTELESSISGQLEQRGKQHLPLASKQAHEALASNVHHFLLPLQQNDFYDEIAVSFSDTALRRQEPPLRQHFRFNNKKFNSPPDQDVAP